MNLYCVICIYTSPEGRVLKAATNDVPAESSADARLNVMDLLAAKGATDVYCTKVAQTGTLAR